MTIPAPGDEPRTQDPEGSDAAGRARAVIEQGRAVLGLELGSTRIKAALIDPEGTTLAQGAHAWESVRVDGHWSYDLDAVREGIRACYAELAEDVRSRWDVPLEHLAGAGISGMMHGYLAVDDEDRLLVPFRTWRNTSTPEASRVLGEALGRNIPLRWSVAHLLQAVLDEEEHVGRIASLTTLAGTVHRWLTGRRVLGIGDASGMFPVDHEAGDFDAALLETFSALEAVRDQPWDLRELLPEVLRAGEDAGELTAEGAALLDPSGTLRPGVPMAPPEGDAGTGMVATNSVRVRTGNVSAGTSAFAMVVLEDDLVTAREEIDLVATPSGDPVAMVHTNNCTGDLDAWIRMLGEFAELLGTPLEDAELYGTLLGASTAGPADAGGLLTYNYLSGEHQTGVPSGRPLFVRTGEARLSLPAFLRAQLYGAFAALATGMDVLLHEEGIALDVLFAHGGIFTTRRIAQQVLADALDTPVAASDSAGEGGAWGMAVLAAYAARARAVGAAELPDLPDYLDEHVFADIERETLTPDPEGVAGYAAWLRDYRAGLPVERLAGEVLP